MTTFLDGPARGQFLRLRHSPESLRVVEAGGKWDALDAPDDKPRPGETVYLYKLIKRSGTVHIDSRRGGKRVGNWYAIASYRYVPPEECLI